MNIAVKETKLNLGCGNTKLKGYVNVDIDPGVNPDFVMDICAFFPFDDNQFEEVLFLHTIEHIEKRWHPTILAEIRRILKEDGRLILGYPEFEECAKNYLSNYRGKRDFWEATIFGRQATKEDFHVCAMNSAEVKDTLLSVGFDKIKIRSEINNPEYTVVIATKGVPRITYAEFMREKVFG